MTNYQQTGKFVFEMKEYQYEIPPEQKGQESWHKNSTEMLDSPIKSISIAN
jgi:hypothetical protein